MKVQTLLGRGVDVPFRRAGGDIVSAEGAEIVKASLRQLLLTRKGELRWRPDFGLNFDRERFKNITTALMARLQAEIATAITTYEPRAEILNIIVEKSDSQTTAVYIRVTWRARSQAGRRNTVLTSEDTVEVEI